MPGSSGSSGPPQDSQGQNLACPVSVHNRENPDVIDPGRHPHALVILSVPLPEFFPFFQHGRNKLPDKSAVIPVNPDGDTFMTDGTLIRKARRQPSRDQDGPNLCLVSQAKP